MKIALDTNVFSDADFLKWLVDNQIESFVSSVAYTELAYHYLKKGKDLEFVRALMKGLKIRVLEYDENDAETASKMAFRDRRFKEKARDYMIGTAAKKIGAVLVTNNKKDFPWLEAKTPKEIMAAGPEI